MQNLDEKILRRFLLGTLGETEQIRLENAVFADADVRARLETVEYDLIDEYARGELPVAEKPQFEKMFFNSPERLQKIEFARTFNRLTAEKTIETAAVGDAKTESFREKITRLFFTPQIAFAGVALLLISGGVFWLIRQTPDSPIARANSNQTSSPIVAQTQAQNSPVQLPPDDGANRKPDGDKPNIVKPPANKNARVPKPPPAPVKAPTESAPIFATLVFPTGALRDGGGGDGKNLVLHLPKNAAQARLIFDLEKGDDFPAYRIEIKSKSGELVANDTVSRRRRRLLLTIPASKLAAGNYFATVRGVSSDGSTETLGYQDFQVVEN